MNNIPQEDIEVLREWEEEMQARGEKRVKKQQPIRIRLRSTGEFITLASGKTVWNGIGPAKSALRNDFTFDSSTGRLFKYDKSDYKHRITGASYSDYSEMRNRSEAAYQYFLDNFVDFVPLT